MKGMLIFALLGMALALWEHHFAEFMWAMWTAVLAYERLSARPSPPREKQ